MTEMPAFEVTASVDSVARWQIGRDGRLGPPPATGAPLPLSYFFFLRMQPALGISAHRLMGRDPDRGLFGGVSYRAQRRPRVGDRLTARGRLTDRKTAPSPHGELTITTLCTTYYDDAGACLEERVRMIDLPPSPPAPPRPGPRRSSALPRLAEIAPVTRTQVAWLSVAIGDLNPLHLDPAYAARRAYPDVVVPGPLIAALLERELAAALGGALAGLDLRLHAASFPMDVFTLHGGGVDDQFAFELYCDGELRAEGRAATGTDLH